MGYKWKIRKGDQVVVTTGKSKGTVGEVLAVKRDAERVLVKGANMVKRHQKPSQTHPQGGLIQKEASLHISNVAHVDPKTKKPTRCGFRFLKDKTRVLFAKKSGEEIKR